MASSTNSDEEEIMEPMVSISKHQIKPIIFPPSNHENLFISTDSLSSHSSSDDLGLISDSDSSFSPSASNSPVFSSPKKLPITNDVSSMGFLSWIINTLCSRFYAFVKRFSFSTNAVLKTALVVLGFLYFRQRKRLRDGETNTSRLIREKQEKINQLLDQVSRMNQVLLGFHKAST